MTLALCSICYRRLLSGGVCALALVGVEAALAQPVPDYGFDWAIIGDVDNPAFEGAENLGTWAGRGSVSYRYRMRVTEVTAGEWKEFLDAYLPFNDSPSNPRTIGNIVDGNFDDQGQTIYLLPLSWRDVPTKMSWRAAARYCNWLHNGKALTKEAFESGVYDTSTFGRDEDNILTDQLTRSDGARFWIPGIDEWLKAAHYDPDRFGPGAPGWWKYSHSSDSPPIIGFPEDVGQTNAGLHNNFSFLLGVPTPRLGSYPDVRSPWGLLDVSGGVREWTEETEPVEVGIRSRVRMTSTAYTSTTSANPLTEDWIGRISSSGPEFSSAGVRIASDAPRKSDLNSDWTTDASDLALLLMQWRVTDAPADLNGNGVVDGADLAQLLAEWGLGPS